MRKPKYRECQQGRRAAATEARAGLACRRSGCWRGCWCSPALTPVPAPGANQRDEGRSPSDRCLLIVETSKSMQRRADAVLGVVQDMLMSGLNGQFRDGGTLGVWTFNEDLYAGRFPLQTWSSSAQKDITQRTLTFLKGQKYEKQANFDKVAPALGRVISDSRRLTVILISSGDWKIRGTPFDDRINGFYQQWHDQQQKARMPFVTDLARQERPGRRLYRQHAAVAAASAATGRGDEDRRRDPRQAP